MTYRQAKAFSEMKLGKVAILVVVEAFRLNVIKENFGPRSLGAREQRDRLESALIQFKETKKVLKNMRSRREHSENGMIDQYKKLKSQMDRIENKLDLLLSNK